jgi:glycerophosphoryl diester phosphodiesterase
LSFWDNFNNKPHLVAAHRGAKSIYPENTMAAFKEALGKCDFVELDVTCSKDGVVVVIHDDTLERTSDAKNVSGFFAPYNVIDYNYDELLKLDFGHGQKIPTLKEVLLFFKEHQFPINVEIKDLKGTKFDQEIVKKVILLILECKMEKLVLLSSFNHDYLRQAYTLAPQISRAALQQNDYPADILAYLKDLKVDSYNPQFKTISPDLIKKLSQAGIFVNIFTVNESKDKIELYKHGAKSLFTDVL